MPTCRILAFCSRIIFSDYARLILGLIGFCVGVFCLLLVWKEYQSRMRLIAFLRMCRMRASRVYTTPGLPTWVSPIFVSLFLATIMDLHILYVPFILLQTIVIILMAIGIIAEICFDLTNRRRRQRESNLSKRVVIIIPIIYITFLAVCALTKSLSLRGK